MSGCTPAPPSLRRWPPSAGGPSSPIPTSAVAAVFAALDGGARIVEARDPCVLPKAIKNATEIAGSQAAHLRDGAALTRFLHWFAGEAPKGGLDEIGAAAKLQQFRDQTNQLEDLSFDTISGAGPNGAIVALPRLARDQPRDRARLAVPGRFGRAVPRRHDRRHPHARRRHPDAPRCATASPAC